MTANAKTVGTELVSLCREGKSLQAIEKLYDDKIVSVEAAATPGFDQITEGKQNVLAKANFWAQNTEVHSFEAEGPYPHGEDKFAVLFKIDCTMKPANQRNTMEEVGIYHVKGGKVVREEFFFDMGQP